MIKAPPKYAAVRWKISKGPMADAGELVGIVAMQ